MNMLNLKNIRLIDKLTYSEYNECQLVPVRTSFDLRRRREKTYNNQLKVDVDKLNAVKVVVS